MTAAELRRRVVAAVEEVIVGQRPAIELCLVALGARGHLLIEDVPGTGKTMLARSLAAALGLGMRRIQCTPDLLPNDVTGVNVLDPRTGELSFRAGPVFAHVVLADEVNRATPRTQAALLEAMQERQVTTEGETRQVPDPFLVLATQNPVEFEGTFPLPEAQLDRFLLSLRLGYPGPDQEAGLVARRGGVHPVERVEPVLDADGVREAIAEADEVHVADDVARYVVEIVTSTRRHSGVALGASPRAGIALGAAARARAALEGRDYVLPDDVKELAVPVLAHRIVLTPEARLHGVSTADVVTEVVAGGTVESDAG